MIKDRENVTLDSLQALDDPGEVENPEELLREFPNVRRLNDDDYKLIRDVLGRYRGGAADESLLRRLATAIADKMDYDATHYRPAPRFLKEVALAYRYATRTREE